MVNWANDGLLQANEGKMLVNDGEMLVNDGEILVNDDEMSIIRSFDQHWEAALTALNSFFFYPNEHILTKILEKLIWMITDFLLPERKSTCR